MAPIDSTQPRTDDDSPYQALIGVGGIGSGLSFALEGNHDLGRNESRPARLVPAHDYCKLHIITHYVAALLHDSTAESPFQILPVGKVGNDDEGRRLLREMNGVGLDTRHVDIVEGKPTLLSICFQYPDQSGGNITTIDSAAAALMSDDIDRLVPQLAAFGSRLIVLAVPEVPLAVRQHLLKLATTHGAFRAASFTSAEILEALRLGILSLVDLLAVNEDEAAALMGHALDVTDPHRLLEDLRATFTASQPEINVVVSAGKRGVFAFAGDRWSHFPALPVQAVSTAGAGDALLAGILVGLIAGAPLSRPESSVADGLGRTLGSAIELGILLASFSVTSLHTIHPEANGESLLDFASELGLTFQGRLGQILTKDELLRT